MRPSFSVVVVSRDRPIDLQRCLMSLVQLDYAVYEIIVVCNSASRLGLDQWRYFDQLKVVDFEEANIFARTCLTARPVCRT